MLIILEIFTAIFAIALLYREAVVEKFRNYATSIFMLFFVPLFCVYPVIARALVGGAYAVGRFNDTIIPGTAVYFVYQIYCIGTLAAVALTMPRAQPEQPLPDWTRKYEASGGELAAVAGIAVGGVLLFIISTSMSIGDLIAGSRFGWINADGYSPVLFVISTYLLGIAPVALILSFANDRYRWPATLGLILALLLYGLITKDRRWLIYMLSAALAYTYLKNQFSITLQRRLVIIGVLAAIPMIFWQVIRGVLFDYYVNDVGDLAYDVQEVAVNLLTKGDFPYYYNASMTAIDMNMNFDFGITFAVVRRQLLFFLPANFSFGLKIEDISALFSDAIGGEDSSRRGNMPPGYFGLFAISFNWFWGIFACSLVPFGLRALDRVIRRNRGLPAIVLLAHMLSSMTMLLRGDDSSATYFIISSTVLLYLARPRFLLGGESGAPAGAT